MTDDYLEKLLEQLQRKIEYDEEKIYSKIVIRECKNPSNFGILDDPDAFAKIKGPCGDTMKITLRIKDRKISGARFWTDGCGATIACGSMVTKIIKGKNLDEVNTITNIQLLEALDGLPEENQHCAKLAVDTLHKAIKSYNSDSNCKAKI